MFILHNSYSFNYGRSEHYVRYFKDIPQLQSDKKVKCYITSSKYRDCQVVGSYIYTEK